MLKTLHNTPIPITATLTLPADINTIAADIMQNGTVYCAKNCFAPTEIDSLRTRIFRHFAAQPHTVKNYGGENWKANYHGIEKGVSLGQKSLHYFHSYVFDDLDALPQSLHGDVKGLFTNLTTIYNGLTQSSRPLIGPHHDGRRFHLQVVQYPRGGGMFAAHTHPLEPFRMSLILGLSKRGRDFNEGAAGFESPDGTIIDTAGTHDIGDLLIFRVDQKHWVTPCDLKHPLDPAAQDGRWVAIMGVY